jgi:hypothetical protein
MGGSCVRLGTHPRAPYQNIRVSHDVYLAQSIDKGISLLKNIRVTTQSWDPAVDAPVDGNGLQFIGDYQGLSSDDHFAHPFWNDTRTGRQEIFTAAIPSATLK